MRIDYEDDTGFPADGEFRGGVMYDPGMVLHCGKAPEVSTSRDD